MLEGIYETRLFSNVSLQLLLVLHAYNAASLFEVSLRTLTASYREQVKRERLRRHTERDKFKV